jgi:sterol desaturase/sphingolipid hydroxylase (fatty acid hydroxylase superfamily)
MLHTPFLYKRVHKLHHTYTQAIGISAEYAHPLEFIIGNMLPLGIPCIILGKQMHYYTFIAIGTLRIIGTTLGHSGYDFPFEPSELLPCRATTRYHDYHHQGNINSNMGGGTIIMDFIFGLNDPYFDHLQRLYSKDGIKAD